MIDEGNKQNELLEQRELRQLLKKLTTKVEADVNFSKVFGVSDEPIMEEVRVKLIVVSDEPEEKIKQAEELALQRCPVVFTLKNPIKLVPSLEIF